MPFILLSEYFKYPWFTYTWTSFLRVIGVASPGSMHDTECLGLVHWDDPEGWYGEGGKLSKIKLGEKKKLNVQDR